MKSPKAIVSLALTGCLLLSACGSGDGGSTTGNNAGNGGATGTNTGTATGRYVEKQLTLPMEDDDYRAVLTQDPDGNPVYFSGDLTRRFDSTDGGLTWTESEGPGANITGIEWFNQIVMLDDGGMLAMVTTTEAVENMTYENSLLHVAADGTVTPVQLEGVRQGNGYFSAILPLSGGRVYINHTYYGGSTVTESMEEEDVPDADVGNTGVVDNSGEGPDDTGGENQTPLVSSEENSTGDGLAENAPPEEGDEEDDESGASTNVYTGSNEYVDTSAIFDAATGAKLKEIPNPTEYSANNGAAGAGKLYVLDYTGAVSVFDDEGTRLNETISFPVDEAGMGGKLATGPDGTVYYIDEKGIYAADENGGSETMLEGAGFAFGNASSSPESMIALADGVFLVQVFGENGYQLYRYEWDPNATINEEQVINVWALRDTNTLRAAVGKYMEKYPDGKVNLTIALSDEGGVDATDAIRTLNTEILSGGGPDVIMLDGVPLDSYIDKGALADLSGLVDTGTYYGNLLQQVKDEDGMYFIPIRATIPLMASNPGYLAGSLDELVKKVQESPAANTDWAVETSFLPEDERSYISFQNLDELWQMMWAANAPAIVNGTEMNTDNLRTLLQAMDDIASHSGYGQLSEEDDFTISGGMYMSAGGAAYTSIEGSLYAHMVGASNSSFFIADDVMALNYLRNQTAFDIYGMGEDEASDKGADFGMLPALQNGVWRPSMLAALSANSKKTEVAADFISLMLSDEIQGSRLADGFAVTQSGMRAQVDNLNQYFEFDGGNMQVDEFDALFETLTTMNLVDDVIGEKIYEHAMPYLRGQYGLDEAISAIEGAVKNYLAERQ